MIKITYPFGPPLMYFNTSMGWTSWSTLIDRDHLSNATNLNLARFSIATNFSLDHGYDC